MSAPLRLGTRRSTLAMAQSQMVADAVAAASGRPVELVPIVSEGDVNRASLSQLGGRGVFANGLREALAADRCDFLVHSLKDLPTAQPEGLVIAATPPREDARDVVVTRDGAPLGSLAAGARVGTGSPRRIAQAKRHNPRLDIRDIRGNVDSRLGRVRDGELDAVILAAAGISRLGGDLGGLHAEALGLAEWPTAPGQGSLAIETRDDIDPDILAALVQLDDEDTRVAITAERTVLSALDAGCSAPVGTHAALADGDLRLRAVVYALDGARRIGIDRTVRLAPGYGGETGSGNGADAADDGGPIARATRAGREAARRLLERGAADLVPRESTT
ncbi:MULTISPECIES: hydroxymethylbilane synthase [unclassified Microbacterium]|uniref:hydroxymethylbilane synthase n=1 Tax=unclassified Microbacterium TaxID=2609290 RepID=UPI0006F24ED1|nr:MULTISPECIES: hydroxymethylbilane synthase [unclassified Microbacterium]AOX46154.1 hydroxymethylbilane synthase [Microbacterium sp. BH-3-3-3]KQT75487.1 porphobilinogen deaminase [Microbacterium sp. Leaf436]